MSLPPEPWVRRTTAADLSVIEAGQSNGQVTLLVHSLTDCADTWRPIARPWLRHRWVVALDLRGHGRSPRFTTAELASGPAEVMVDDVVELLQQLSATFGPVDMVGHSLGGVLALVAAVRCPELVRCFVLEDPAPAEGDWLPGFKEPFLAEQLRALDAFAAADPGEWPRPGERWSADELAPWHESKPLVDRGLILSGKVVPAGRLADLAEAVRVPTLILAADPSHLDQALPPVANPLVRVEKVGGAGHCIHRDDPDGFHRLVAEWLDVQTEQHDEPVR